MKYSRRSAGFTLVELLVVIAIIGILIALLLPAVQAAREAARRSQCVNNMKQVGIALHNYHDSHKAFPPRAVYADERAKALGTVVPYHYTWLAMVLPYMEQQPLYDSADWQYPIYGTTPQLIASTLVTGLLCPSDASSPGEIGSRSADLAWTNYAGATAWDWWGKDSRTVSSDPTVGRILPGTLRSNGLFSYKTSKRMRDILDGTSNTVVVAEVTFSRYTSGTEYANGSGRPLLTTGGNQVTFAFVAHDQGGDLNAEGYLSADGAGTMGGSFQGVRGWGAFFLTHVGFNNSWSGACSMHPGILNVLMGDGSTRGLSETTEYATWFMLCAMADNQPLPEF